MLRDLSFKCISDDVVELTNDFASCVPSHISGSVIFESTFFAVQVTVQVNCPSVSLIPFKVNGVMEHHHLGAVVADVQVIVRALEACAELGILHELAIVIALDENLGAVETVDEAHCGVHVAECNVAQDVNRVVNPDPFVPHANHFLMHVGNVLEVAPGIRAKLHDVLMSKMEI